jgi:tetratricopeptide (TPR) repeat protein
VTFQDARSASNALIAQKVSFKGDLISINSPISTMWRRYTRLGADKPSPTPGLLHRMDDNSASDQLQPPKPVSQSRQTTDDTRSRAPIPSPASKPNMKHRIGDSLDTNHSFAAKEPGPHRPGASPNVQQYHQLERDSTFETKASTSSMIDEIPINPNNSLAMIERNPESTTTMSQHQLYDIACLKHKLSMSETETNKLRDEHDATLTQANRLAEDFARANNEIRRLNMKISDLGTENGAMKRTVRSLEKELQLAEARVIDAQRQAPTNRPPHDHYIHHDDHSAQIAEVHALYARGLQHLERLKEEQKTLLDDNQDLRGIVEGLKDAEVDLKKALKSHRTDNEALRERLAAANKFARTELILNRELESKRNRIAQLTQGKGDAERALEHLKSTLNMGPELINAFSVLESMASQEGSRVSRKHGSGPTSSNGRFTRGSRGPSVPIPKRQRYE